MNVAIIVHTLTYIHACMHTYTYLYYSNYSCLSVVNIVYVHSFCDTVNCTCDVRVSTEVNNTLRTVCTGPSTEPCVCNNTNCRVSM